MEQKLFNELLQRTKFRAKARRQQANALAEDDKALAMINVSGTIQALITPSLSVVSGWRVTYIDKDGPIGHGEFQNKRLAVLDALEQNYRLI